VSDADDVTWQRQGQSNLGTYTAGREDRELSTSVIDQFKIRWAINTFKLFKLAGTDEVLHALLQHRAEYLTTHLCRHFIACLAHIAWRQFKVTFIPKTGMANCTRQRHIVLLFYRHSCWKQWKNWRTGTLVTRSWVCIPYIDKNLSTNQESLLNLHCIL
jgi:hypothetical protein